MLAKYSVTTGINLEKYTFPIAVTDQEIDLCNLHLTDLVPGDHIILEAGVGWQKNLDIGELEIMIRKDSPSGPILYQTEDTCFHTTYSVMKHIDKDIQEDTHAYYLTVKSTSSHINQAKVTENVSLTATVVVP
jgi:hypothetical protein